MCYMVSYFSQVKVVNHPELSQYVDILLMPIKGKRSLASLLSGGDYDGGNVLVTSD
jgi:RNA-dependent RNA polymerase